MRNSKQIQSKIDLTQLQSLSKQQIPESSSTNLQQKFKNLRKTFLLNKSHFRQVIKRENRTSHSLTRQLNSLIEKESQSSQYLISLKKAYDGVSQLSLKKQTQTLSLKEEVAKMRRDLDYKNREKENETRYLKQVQKDHWQAKQKEEQSITQSKTLQHIIQRSKNDEIIMKIKIKKLQRQLRRVKEQVKMGEAKKLSFSQLKHISSNMTKQILDIHIQKDQQRKQTRQFYQKHLKQLKSLDNKQKQQHRMTQQIQALAASDWNDSNIQKWKKLLFVELTLRKMLLSKIKRLETKYMKDRDAFHKIRVKTKLEDPKSITFGFYKMASTTTDLYNDIEILQQRQIKLKQTKQRLKKQYQMQVEEYYETAGIEDNQDEQQQLSLKIKQKQSLEKYLQTQLFQQKLYHWWCQNSNKFRSSTQKVKMNSKIIKEIHPIQNLGDFINVFCQQLINKHFEFKKQVEQKPIKLSQLLRIQSVVKGDFMKNYDDQGTETEGNKKARFRI